MIERDLPRKSSKERLKHADKLINVFKGWNLELGVARAILSWRNIEILDMKDVVSVKIPKSRVPGVETTLQFWTESKEIHFNAPARTKKGLRELYVFGGLENVSRAEIWADINFIPPKISSVVFYSDNGSALRVFKDGALNLDAK